MKKKCLALLSAALLLMIALLGACASTGGKNAADDVQLSEVMAKNNGILADNDEEYPDWIEAAPIPPTSPSASRTTG